MSLITREGNSIKINLTIPFLVWTLAFITLALVSGHNGLLWVAALPWLLMGLFMVTIMGIGAVALGLAYASGRRVRLTTPSGRVRYIQRGRK